MKNVHQLDVLNVVAVLNGKVGFVGHVELFQLRLTEAALRYFS
jgi:hypothetical protein